MRPLLLLLTIVYCLYAKAQVHKNGQACTHYHAASDINSGTFADARISASNVTQHQGSLTLAISQITNLQSTLDGKAASSHTHGQSDVTNLTSDLALKAPLASPTFTGTPAAPTPAFNTNTTQLATTAYVMSQQATFARVTGSDVTTTGQSLVDITGLSIALTTNAVYEIEANLSVLTSAVTTGTQYGIQYSAAGAAIEAQVTGSLTSTAAKTERISALNTATTAFLTTSAQNGGIRITGIVTTGANAGNLTVRHLKVTSGTSTVRINSFLKVTRIQ